MARFARALSIAMFVAAAMPVCSASAAVDEVAQGREIAQRLCAGCHMRPGQGEKSDHSQIPSFRAVANRPGQSLEGTASWLKIAPPTMRTIASRARNGLISPPSSCRCAKVTDKARACATSRADRILTAVKGTAGSTG